jgi:hypothetical protein
MWPFKQGCGKLFAVAPLPNEKALLLSCINDDNGKRKKLVAHVVRTDGLCHLVSSEV